MVNFIFKSIMKDSEISLEASQEKYRKYFIYIKIYERYRLDVEALLKENGYESSIVDK